MLYVTFVSAGVALGILGVAFAASFWFDFLSSLNVYAALMVCLLFTTLFMAILTTVAALYSAGAFCPELLTTAAKCDVLYQKRWVFLLLLIWVPVVLYALAVRLRMAKNHEEIA